MQRLRMILTLSLLLLAAVAGYAQPDSWTRYYDIIPDGGDWGNSYESRIIDIDVAADGSILILGEFNLNPYWEDRDPFLMKIDTDFNMEWARTYVPPSFESFAMDVTPAGNVLIGGRRHHFPPVDSSNPFVSAMNEFGNPIDWEAWPSVGTGAVSDVISLEQSGGFAITLRRSHGDSLRVKRYRGDGVLLWTTRLPVPSQYDDVFELPDGDLAVISGAFWDDALRFYILDVGGGDVTYQYEFPFDVGSNRAVMAPDGTFFVQDLNDHLMLKFPPPYDGVTDQVGAGSDVAVAATSDGGFIVSSGNGSTVKYSSEMEQEWVVDGGGNVITEVEPGVYAASSPAWFANDTDVKLVMIGLPEPDPTPLDLYLYQEWDEPFSVPADGGTVAFTETVTNTWNIPQTVEQWINLHHPDGTVEVGNPVTRTYEPGGFTFTDYEFSIPAAAPPGNYAWVMYLGTPEDSVITSSSAIFRKLGGVGTAGQPFLNDFEHASIQLLDTEETTPESQSSADNSLPERFALGASYPNPFNSTTRITLFLPETGPVRVTLTDLLGREVLTLSDGTISPGEHEFSVNAHGLSSGVYFIRARSNDGETVVRKLMLLR